MDKLTEFQDEIVEFVESMKVTNGVVCDIYSYPTDVTKDLGIVTVQPGCKTPRMKILKGDQTIEGCLSGSANLTRIDQDGEFVHTYTSESETIELQIGEIVQWEVLGEEPFVFYEICYPPYQDGRYKNLSE